MKKGIIAIFLLVVVVVFSCKTNPFTGKSTLNFMPNSTLFPMAFNQYSSFLKENKVIKGTRDAEMVKRVGERITRAAEIWLESKGYKGYLKDYNWQYNLVQSSEVNAWCMPGGGIVVYTGIFPITQNEAGLAVVMGHEVAHALADHGAQRMSAGTIQQLGAAVTDLASQNSKYAKEIQMAYGLGTNLGGMLPFSRSHETEADEIGIQIMAIAGYNPEEAPKLWYRMQQNSQSSTPEWFSTHPSNASRINNLQNWVGRAKAEAAKFGVTKFR